MCFLKKKMCMVGPPRSRPPALAPGLDNFLEKFVCVLYTFTIISPGVDNNQLPARFSQEEVSTALVPIGLTPPPQLPKATSL